MADVIIGKTTAGLRVPVQVLADGRLVISGAAGGSTDMTTTNALLTSANADLAQIIAATQSGAGFNIPKHDYVECSYTSGNLTGVVYRMGGSSGSVVGTLTLAYDGSNNLTSTTLS